MPVDVPPALRFVESFLNSVDAETGADDLAELDRFRRWLTDHHRPAAARTATAADLDLARTLRRELRAEAETHHDGGARRDRSALDPVSRQVPLAVGFGPDGTPTPVPTGAGVLGVLGEVLAAVALAAHDGSWRRLKICPAQDCRWLYYDASRNSSRRWCSMKVCGNRNKTRAYRRRTGAG